MKKKSTINCIRYYSCFVCKVYYLGVSVTYNLDSLCQCIGFRWSSCIICDTKWDKLSEPVQETQLSFHHEDDVNCFSSSAACIYSKFNVMNAASNVF